MQTTGQAQSGKLLQVGKEVKTAEFFTGEQG
jgi:hypothetical protein